jgi:hypothetical protein
VFRGWELTRLLTMIAFLAVLGTVIYRTGGLAGDGQPSQVAPAAAAPADSARKTSGGADTAEAVTSGPTDEDPDQRAEAEEEFQAVTDGSLGVQPEEMLIYWRLFTWVEHQSLETLRQRSRGDLVYNDFVQSPDKCRGRLVRLDLNVRRVLAYDVEDSPADVKRVYEIWGWTDDAKAWLYDVVTAHLPEGMPIGPEVEARATFVGYFFKLQGYYETGAKPRAAPLRAPLLVGRLIRSPLAVEPAAPQPHTWILVGAGAIVLLFAGAAAVGFLFSRRRSRQPATRRQYQHEAVDDWLQQGPGADVEPPFPTDEALPSGNRDRS